MCLLGYAEAVAQQGSPFRLQAPAQQTININQTITANDTLNVFGNVGNIYGLSVNMTVTRNADYFLVRLILEDTDGKDYLLGESYREIAISDTMVFNGYCEETALLFGIQPQSLKIYVENANVSLHSIQLLTIAPYLSPPLTPVTLKDSLQREQVIYKTNIINNYNSQHEKLWYADVTPLSLMPYMERANVLNMSGDISTSGIEYYSGGLFDIGEFNNVPIASTFILKEFDWCNYHGINWMTPVKNQFSTPYCVPFAITGLIEANINTYFNQQLNFDLSEQQISCCTVLNPEPYKRISISPSNAFSYIENNGITLEKSYPFDCYAPQTCMYDEELDSLRIKIAGENMLSFNENVIKQELINKGPLLFLISVKDSTKVTIPTWGHAMVLAGYGKVEEGMTITPFHNGEPPATFGITVGSNNPYIGRTYWKLKNSWGTDDGDGYMYVIVGDSKVQVLIFAVVLPITIEGENDVHVICKDYDKDGYYTWGTGQRLAEVPFWAPYLQDADDTNPYIGELDYYGNFANINPNENDTIFIRSNSNSLDWIGNCMYRHVVITSGVTFSILKFHKFFNGATLYIKNGASLVVKENGCLDNANIIMEAGSSLTIKENGIVNIAKDGILNIPAGAILNLLYGEININKE